MSKKGRVLYERLALFGEIVTAWKEKDMFFNQFNSQDLSAGPDSGVDKSVTWADFTPENLYMPQR